MAKKWILSKRHTRRIYAVGLKPGDRVTPIRRLPRYRGRSTRPYAFYEPGQVFEVLPGSSETPGVIWLLNPNQERCTWDDSELFFVDFARC